MVIDQKKLSYSLLILATDIAAFNLYAGRQDMQPPLKSMPLLSNQQQMTRRQSFPFTYSNKLLTAKGTAWKSTLVSVHKKKQKLG